MSEQDLQRLKREITAEIAELGSRIRRYTLDDRLEQKDLDDLNTQWTRWQQRRVEFYALPAGAAEDKLRLMETAVLEIDRAVDIIQRKLVSSQSYKAGVSTTALLGLTLGFSILLYLPMHGVTFHWLWIDFSEFEPLAEWGPLKYIEVGFWSFFGVMCWLIYLAASYTSKRDFDKWYQPWYFATAVRAPLLTMLLMVIVLEFVEWWAEDSSWIKPVLEDGNKFYFIVFMSFSLGLISDQSSAIARDLAEGVGEFVQAVVQRFSRKMRSAVEPDSTVTK